MILGISSAMLWVVKSELVHGIEAITFSTDLNIEEYLSQLEVGLCQWGKLQEYQFFMNYKANIFRKVIKTT